MRKLEQRAKPTYEEFARDYLYPNKPVVITEAIREWPALARWTPEFFRKEFPDKKLTFPATGGGRREIRMADFIETVVQSSPANPAPYWRNEIFYNEFPTLRQDIEPLPKYFEPSWLSEEFLIRRVNTLFHRASELEIYIGGTGGKFPILHYDAFAVHAFLVQLYGEKLFYLFEPDQTAFLYPQPDNPSLSQLNDVENPDLERFPLFAKAKPISHVLRPGEMLFIPSRWWHTTRMLTASISLSANVVNASNWQSVTDYALAKRSPSSRLVAKFYFKWAGARRSKRDRALGFDGKLR